jgi:hypothetical protein
MSNDSTIANSRGGTQTTTIYIKDGAEVITIVPLNESLNWHYIGIGRKTINERIYHTVNVVGEAWKRSILIA